MEMSNNIVDDFDISGVDSFTYCMVFMYLCIYGLRTASFTIVSVKKLLHYQAGGLLQTGIFIT